MILQLKTGRIATAYFQRKFGVDILTEFATASDKLQGEGWLTVGADAVELTPAGLMQIDRHLPAFFDEQYRGPRYT